MEKSLATSAGKLSSVHLLAMLRPLMSLLRLVSSTIRVPWLNVEDNERKQEGMDATDMSDVGDATAAAVPRNRNYFNSVNIEMVRLKTLSLELTERGRREQRQLKGISEHGESAGSQFSPRNWSELQLITVL